MTGVCPFTILGRLELFYLNFTNNQMLQIISSSNVNLTLFLVVFISMNACDQGPQMKGRTMITIDYNVISPHPVPCDGFTGFMSSSIDPQLTKSLGRNIPAFPVFPAAFPHAPLLRWHHDYQYHASLLPLEKPL